MKINLTDVSINFSPKLPEVVLEIPKIELDLVANMAKVYYKHSIPFHIPNQPESFATIEDNIVNLPIPQEFLDLLMVYYTRYTASRYGNNT
ncbi:MAG: hypothetical protein IM526_02660 [Microcystis sp. M38BS1]|uniref:hypothetical protein n=1 Tax=Microcystis sp. M38BS1 TaxID=2771188 RepID=UPI0031FBE959|nr:hypothetical protein [Microcystis sp. M38BS1]MCA6582562.1 hypothetical protein [Pseudanabaena sp. M34BS1SP1A06MG]